jgi:hypothetical protein
LILSLNFEKYRDDNKYFTQTLLKSSIFSVFLLESFIFQSHPSSTSGLQFSLTRAKKKRKNNKKNYEQFVNITIRKDPQCILHNKLLMNFRFIVIS